MRRAFKSGRRGAKGERSTLSHAFRPPTCFLHRRKRGFTLIEALAAILILSVGIAAVYGGLGALTRGESRARQQDLVQRLADEKYEELIATADDLNAPQSGDFSDREMPDLVWEMESAATGIENLQSIVVRVEPRQSDGRAPTGEASGVVYVPPVTSEGGATQ